MFWRSLTIYRQVEPSAVRSCVGGAVGEEDATLVPAPVSLADGGEVDGALAQRGAWGRQTHSLLVALSSRQNTVVAGEHRAVLQQVQSILYDTNM